MDLGIAGRTALICASSRGLGRACAEALAAEGVTVVINGRSPEGLERAAQEIRDAHGVAVQRVLADVSTAEGRALLLERCPDPDILVTNNAGPPTGPFADFDEAAWTAALAAQMLAPLMLVRATAPGMVRRGFGRIVNITSAQVKSPRAEMTLSAGPRAGLTAALKGLSFELAPHNVTINNLLPERIGTQRQRDLAAKVAAQRGIPFEAAYAERGQGVAAKRMGEPHEFGAACAFLCSAQAGFISGQNLQIDGGTYHGLI